MPDPVPVMVIGRLAVEQDWHKKGIGRTLLRDAMLRTIQAAEFAGIRAILVHAKSEAAKSFYESCGLHSSPVEPMTLMITIADARRALGMARPLTISALTMYLRAARTGSATDRHASSER